MNKSKITDEEVSSIIDLYNQYKSINEVAKHFTYDPTTIHKVLKKNHIDTKMDRAAQRKRMIKYPIDENYFEEINSRDKSYILGIILSDGHLFHNGKQVRIKLTDVDLLEEIKLKIGYDKPLNDDIKSKVHHKNSKSLIICNSKICNDLVRAGLIANKSYFNKFPNLTEELIPDFIRGFFDGNGSIYVSKTNRPEIKIVSTLKFLMDMNNYLNKMGVNSYLDHDKRTDDRISNLRIRSQHGVEAFFGLVYFNVENQLYLDRKYQKFKSYYTIKYGSV